MSGTISSGIGLISGLPTQSIIDQLIALEARPLTLLQTRITNLQTQRTALAEISARLLGLQGTTARFDEPAFFRAATAVSSNDNVLTAIAAENASPGTFQFQVKSLVSNHQLISEGFANTGSQPVGLGSLAIELGNGRLNQATTLDRLNGGAGMRRGSIEITDSTGDRAVIDLGTALTVQDVVGEINSRTDVAVFARVASDHLVIEDQAGGTINIRDLAGGHAAEDLGIAQVGDGEIVGDAIIFLHDGTRLGQLNDGNGVGVGVLNEDIEVAVGGNTFTVGLRDVLTHQTHLNQLNNGNAVRVGVIRITNQTGASAEIEIDDDVETIGEVIDLIEGAGLDLEVSLGAVSGQLLLRDNSVPESGAETVNFKIEDVSGHAGADLGILADSDAALITGSEVYRVDTLGDVLRAINYAVDASDPGNVVRNEEVVAAISDSGRGIKLTSLSGDEFVVRAGEDASTAAAQLGLLSGVEDGEPVGQSVGGSYVARDALAGLNSVLLSTLRGGSGIELGEVKFTDAAGAQVNINFTSDPPATVQDFVDRVNAATASASVGITARLNDAGNGLVFEDTSGGGGAMRMKDVGSAGTTVADLFDLENGDVQSAGGVLSTGNAQLQYVSTATALTELNLGRGVSKGAFAITASDGTAITVTLNENQRTVGDVLRLINALGDDVGLEARINDNGDGIELLDSTGGTGVFSVADVSGGRTARDLNIAGEGRTFEANGETRQRIDGSFEFRVEVDADDTLADVETKIDELGIDVSASIVNDGSGDSPFHLVISSLVSGRDGQLTLDAGSTGLSFDTLVEASDAVVFFGGAGATNPIVLTSSTNTLSGVLENVTIDLVGTSDEPVELSVSRDIERIVTDLGNFVSSFNGALDSIDEHTSFDPETGDRGLLFGDSAVNQIRNRLRTVAITRVPGAPEGLNRLVLIGVSTGNGGRLSFDENKFRDLFNEDPEAIEALFTAEEGGIGDRMEEILDDLTNSFDGLLPRRDRLLGDREELFNDRISRLEDSLARKRSRLQRQFQGLESALSNLQGAQSALGVISSAAAGATGGL